MRTPPVSVLVAGESVLVVESISALLAAWYNVLPARTLFDWTVAVSLPAEADIVVVDWIVERGMSGLATLILANRAKRFIVLVGAPRHSLLEAAMSIGAHGFLLSTCHDVELRLAIEEVSAGRRYVTPEVDRRRGTGDGRPLLSDGRPLAFKDARILQLLLGGSVQREVAAQMHMTSKGIERRLHLLRPLAGCRTTAQLVRWAERCGITPPQ